MKKQFQGHYYFKMAYKKHKFDEGFNNNEL